jgi:hypothetical protein
MSPPIRCNAAINCDPSSAEIQLCVVDPSRMPLNGPHDYSAATACVASVLTIRGRIDWISYTWLTISPMKELVPVV